MVDVEELVLSLSRLSAFDTVDSAAVVESLWVLVVCVRHRWDMVAAVEMFMVIMTF